MYRFIIIFIFPINSFPDLISWLNWKCQPFTWNRHIPASLRIRNKEIIWGLSRKPKSHCDFKCRISRRDQKMLITGKCSWRCPSKGIMAASSSKGHRCICQRRGPYITSQGGPFCLAAPFLWIQQECSLQNLAPVAWHLVKLIHRQETNCQIKWVSSSLPLPSRLACGQDNIAYLPLSRHITAKCPPAFMRSQERDVQKSELLPTAS